MGVRVQSGAFVNGTFRCSRNVAGIGVVDPDVAGRPARRGTVDENERNVVLTDAGIRAVEVKQGDPFRLVNQESSGALF